MTFTNTFGDDDELDVDPEDEVSSQFDMLGLLVDNEQGYPVPNTGSSPGREARKIARNQPPPEMALVMTDMPVGIDPVKISTFFKKIRSGVPLSTSLASSRLSKAQFKNWAELAEEDPDSWYGKLMEEYAFCMSAWECKHIQKLNQEAKRPGQWKLNLKLLEICRNDNWGPRFTMSHTPAVVSTVPAPVFVEPIAAVIEPVIDVLPGECSEADLKVLDSISLESFNKMVAVPKVVGKTKAEKDSGK